MTALPVLSAPSVSRPCTHDGAWTTPVSTAPNGRNVVRTGDRIAEALRQSVGLGQPGGLPPKQLAGDLGVDVKTIYGWMAGNGMRADHFVALIDLMPASFGNFVLAPTGATLVKLADKRAALAKAQAEYEEAMRIANGG